jgi:toxin CptA
MHSAPSVTYPVGRSPFAGVLLLAIWLAGAAALLSWWMSGGSGSRLGSAALLWLVSGLWAARQWWRSPTGAVAWNGESWNWAAGEAGDNGVLEVSLDLQRSMLVRWAGEGASRWFWLQRASRTERWDDLRRAVYSRAAASAPQDAKRPLTKP